MNLPFLIRNQYREIVRTICKEQNEICDHWLDDKKFMQLYLKDKKKAREYLKDFFEPRAHITLQPLKATIKCNSLDLLSGLKFCDKKFPKSEKVLYKKFKEILKITIQVGRRKESI